MTAIHASAQLLATDAPRFCVQAIADPGRRPLKVPKGIERGHLHQWDFCGEESGRDPYEIAHWHGPLLFVVRQSFAPQSSPRKVHVCLSTTSWHWQNVELFATFPEP
tara:strand:- start:868 stop:1188 length:321 start_codon:yes stop_codon:yes gene_type:complete